MTWSEKKYNFGLSVKFGISKELAKKLSPMHIKCIKLYIEMQGLTMLK
jgi:hypothetical protein